MKKLILATVVFVTLSSHAAINPNDIMLDKPGCSSLPTAMTDKAKALSFAKNGSDIEICSSMSELSQTDLLYLDFAARQNITMFIDSDKFSPSVLQSLSQQGVNISLSTTKMKQAGLNSDNITYLFQSNTPGKVRLFVNSKDDIDMNRLASLSTKPIEMHVYLEKSPVDSKSNLDRLAQQLRNRLTVYTNGSTLSESELQQARNFGAHIKLIN